MGFREFCHQWNFRWKMLTWWDIFKVSMDETILMTRYSTLPAMFCTGLAVSGNENLFLLMILSIVAAYFAHRKQKTFFTKSELFSPLELVRYITFFLIIVKCSYLISYLPYYKKSRDVDENMYQFIGCYAKVAGNMALYRFYLCFCGAITKSVATKIQKNSIKSKLSLKQVPTPRKGEGDGELRVE